MGELCMMIGVFLYCGNSSNPTAMFTQSNNYPTAYMAEQMLQAQQYRNTPQPQYDATYPTYAAPTTTCQRDEVAMGTACVKFWGAK